MYVFLNIFNICSILCNVCHYIEKEDVSHAKKPPAEKKLSHILPSASKVCRSKFVNAPVLESLLCEKKGGEPFKTTFIACRSPESFCKSFHFHVFVQLYFFSFTIFFYIRIGFYIAIVSRSKLTSGKWKWWVILDFSGSTKDSLVLTRTDSC